MDVLECKHGGYDKVGFVRKDIYNFSSRYKRSRIVDGDANVVLEILKGRRGKDPYFFYEYEVDIEGHLKSLFGVTHGPVWIINRLAIFSYLTTLTR